MNKTPILVAYNIPGRDCGLYSAGGSKSVDNYKEWISSFAGAIGARKAVIILEPDALPQLNCLTAEDKQARLDLFQYAVSQFKEKAPNVYLYLDIGHSEWLSVADAATRLIQAGIMDARGFSLNVSNYKTTVSNIDYGDAVNAALKQQKGMTKTFVIDTSRNGNGPFGKQWCDPAGRKLGVSSQETLTGKQPEMYLWIKNPGNADGCAAPAGTFSPDIAYKLINGL